MAQTFTNHKNIRESKQNTIEYWRSAERQLNNQNDMRFIAGADSIHDFNGSRIRGTDNPLQPITTYYLAANLYEFSNKFSNKSDKQTYNHEDIENTTETDNHLSEWVKNSFGKKRAINPTGGSVEPETENYFQQKYSSQLYTDKKIKITYRQIIEGFKKYSENGKLSNPDALKKLIITDYMNKTEKNDYYCMEIVANYTGQDQSVFWNSFTPQDRKHIGIFILNFFMMNSTSDKGLNYQNNSYISFDANAPVLSKRIFTDMIQVNNLVTPSNLADSAGSEKHLLNEKEQGELNEKKNPKGPSRYTYYFPEHDTGKYYYTSNLFTYDDMVIYLERDTPTTEYNHTNRYNFSINFKPKEAKENDYKVDFGDQMYHTGPSVAYLGSLISNLGKGLWKDSHCADIDNIVTGKGVTLANKANNFKLLFDIKRSGDWEQCNACHHANTTKYKSRCILSTGDRLCSLYSRLIEQNVIFSNNDTLRMYRFPQSLTDAEARSMLDEKNIAKINSTIANIESINEPLNKYYGNIIKMREPLIQKIDTINKTPSTKSTINNSIETFLTKIAYILFEININKLLTFVDDYGKYLADITLIKQAIDTPYTTSITKLGMNAYFTNTPIPLERWLTTHRGALNWYYHTESSDADKTEFITKFITRYLQKDEGTFLSKIEHFTNTFTNMFLITNISTLNLKKKFKIDKDSIVPTLVFGSYSIDNLYALKNKLTNIISFRNNARGKVVNLLDVIGNDFFDILREINSEIDNNNDIFTGTEDPIKTDIHKKITNVLKYINDKNEDKTDNIKIKSSILCALDLSPDKCEQQGGGDDDDDTEFVSIQDLSISDSIGMLDYNIFLSFFTDGAKIIEDGIKQESPNIDLLNDFIPAIDTFIDPAAATPAAATPAAATPAAATPAAEPTTDKDKNKWNIKNNLKYIYDLLPILYNRSIIHFKVWKHFDTKFFKNDITYGDDIDGIIPGKNYKKTESNLTYIVIQSEREDILFALNEYKIKGGETIVPDGKEDVYKLVNEYLYKDISFSESLFSSISDYEKELNEHTFTGMVKIGLIKGSNGQIYSNTLSYGLTNLIQSLIATFSFLIIIDHYDDDPVDVSNIGEGTFAGIFTQIYGKYLLFEFDHENPSKKTCLEQMSTILSKMPIDIIEVCKDLKTQLTNYTGLTTDDLTKQNKFHKLLAHIYVFYNDINCEYIKVVKNIPKKKIVAVGAVGAVEDTTVAEGEVEATTVAEGTVVTPVVETNDDEDCSCFIGDDTDDAATAATTDVTTAADRVQLISDSMSLKLKSILEKETPEEKTPEQETPEQEAARNNTFNKVIELLMNNNMDNNSSGIMEPITNVYDYITKQKDSPATNQSNEIKERRLNYLPKKFKVKETLEKTSRFKKDHSQGIQFLYRNSYIFIYLYLKYILQNNTVKTDTTGDYSDFIKGGSNEQSIEEQMIRLIS